MPTTYAGPIYLTGDMVAHTGSAPTTDPPGFNSSQAGFGMKVLGAEALGDTDTHYRLVWSGNTGSQGTDTYFRNGQSWQLQVYDGSGNPEDDRSWSSVPGYERLNPKNDLVQGMGASKHYIVFEMQNAQPGGQHLIFDINGGLPEGPETLIYHEVDRRDEFGFEDCNNPPPCLARGTMIDTPNGPRAIEYLAVGDLVMTADNGPQPIRWIGSRLLSAGRLMLSPEYRPVRIKAGALGENIPTTDLVVSPQHRVLVRSRLAQRIFGANEVLVAAKQLLQIDGISIATDLAEVEYFHMLFDRHEVIFSNGASTESLYTGPMALKSLGQAAQKEIFALFPELKDLDYTPVAARILANGRMGRKLAGRHQMNLRPLVN